MTEPVLHLVHGPPEHGVVRCALDLAAALRSPVVHESELGTITAPLHVHFTDRLFGTSAPLAADAFVALVSSHCAPISVTLHDIPQPSDGRGYAARTDAYRRVVDAAHAVAVSSRHEKMLLAEALGIDHSPSVVPLAIDHDRTPPKCPPQQRKDIAVMGFVYPGKGHREVLEALTPVNTEYGFLAIGSASTGHEHLVTDLRADAHRLGRRFEITGFVPDDALTALLTAVAVPVAFHRHMSASGSINSWIAAGRRPLVPRGRYVDEMEDRSPGSLWIHDDSESALGEAIETALRHPGRTWRAQDVVPYPSMAQAAALYRAEFDRWFR